MVKSENLHFMRYISYLLIIEFLCRILLTIAINTTKIKNNKLLSIRQDGV